MRETRYFANQMAIDDQIHTIYHLLSFLDNSRHRMFKQVKRIIKVIFYDFENIDVNFRRHRNKILSFILVPMREQTKA